MAADVDSDGAGTRPLLDADAESWASDESVGLDAVVASSCGGVYGGDRDGDAPVSTIGTWRQDGRSTAHAERLRCTERLRCIFGLRTLRFGRHGTRGSLSFKI